MPILAIISGLTLLVWSAGRFVTASAATASYLGMPPLLIGMVIVGFGTSSPELLVSVLAAFQGNPGIALGNAYGSNINNIALILGVTAIVSPIAARSGILRKELPILTGVTLLAAWQLRDSIITRGDSIWLLSVLCILMGWSIWQALATRADNLGREIERELGENSMPLRSSITWIVLGLLLLIISSHLLVWGAVEIATDFGVSDLIIGLTIVAAGTALPELASCVAAVKKGEHDIALGNVLGSNLFNTLGVVGIAGLVRPITTEPEVLTRDVLMMFVLTLSLFIICYGFRGRPGRINRFEGTALVATYAGYTAYLISTAFIH